jgi:hypothetical protein
MSDQGAENGLLGLGNDNLGLRAAKDVHKAQLK